jgi:diguanylate cyclase (GGDEF)-like protein/PAS domain S-box-containing protein
MDGATSCATEGGIDRCVEHERLRMLSRIAEQVGDGVAVTDNDGSFVYVNPAFASIHGCPDEDLVGHHFSTFYSGTEHAAAVRALIHPALEHGVARAEMLRLRRDGTPFPAAVTLSLLHDDDGALIGRVLTVQDISERRAMEEQLRREALHDPLTGLPNRRLLHDRLSLALAAVPRRGHAVAVLFVDLNDFKSVNDTLGHTAGDQLLIAAAARLGRLLRPEDTLARLGGDEFVIVLPAVTHAQQAAAVAQRVLQEFETPFSVSDRQVPITASVGSAVTCTGSADALLAAADAAMYRAKSAGKACGRTGGQIVVDQPALCESARDACS